MMRPFPSRLPRPCSSSWPSRSRWPARGRARELRASLPQLDGEHQVARTRGAGHDHARRSRHPDHPRRHARGRRARHRFLHAQDRFFQMDLARRRAAGELSALVGPRALALDREIRVHRFRAEARRAVVAADAPAIARILEAYTAGVNSGLAALARGPVRVPGAAPGSGAVAARGQPARRSCRCSSRCRTPTARTSRRSAR